MNQITELKTIKITKKNIQFNKLFLEYQYRMQTKPLSNGVELGNYIKDCNKYLKTINIIISQSTAFNIEIFKEYNIKKINIIKKIIQKNKNLYRRKKLLQLNYKLYKQIKQKIIFKTLELIHKSINIQFKELMLKKYGIKYYHKVKNIYKNEIYLKILNILMKCGNKEKVENLINSSFSTINYNIYNKTKKKNPLIYLNKALNKIKPIMWIKSQYYRGKKYSIPKELNNKQQISKSVRWFVENIVDSNSINFIPKFTNELKNVYLNKSTIYKKKQIVYNNIRLNKSNLYLKK